VFRDDGEAARERFGQTLEAIQRRLSTVKTGRTKPAQEAFNWPREHGMPR